MNRVISPELREQLHAQLDRMLDGLPAQLKEVDQAEQALERDLRRLAGAAMQAWADGASRADGAPLCPACGQRMRHRGCPAVELETTLGRVTFRRPRRRCPSCAKECYPHDAALRFQQHAVTWRLARLVVRLDARHPFDEARLLLREDYRIELSKQTFQQIVQHAGERVLKQDDAQRAAFFSLPAAAQGPALPRSTLSPPPQVVAVSMDGTRMHAEGEWREIRVGRVVAQDAEGQRLAQKSFARFLPVEEVGRQLYLDAHRVGYAQAAKRVVLGDGAPWIWELAATFFPEAQTVLDWYHLSENVHAAARVVQGTETPAAEAWAQGLLDHLWEGRSAEARRQVGEWRKQVRSPAKREALRKLAGYLKNNASRMNYPAYRQAGLPCGSGMIESHCKSLVGQRCKGSGMRNWGQRNAETVLRFRAALLDRDFDALWANQLDSAA